MVWRVPGKFQTVADEVKLPRFGSLQPCLADSELWRVLVFACICQVPAPSGPGKFQRI